MLSASRALHLSVATAAVSSQNSCGRAVSSSEPTMDLDMLPWKMRKTPLAQKTQEKPGNEEEKRRKPKKSAVACPSKAVVACPSKAAVACPSKASVLCATEGAERKPLSLPRSLCKKVLRIGSDCSGWESILMALFGMGISFDSVFSSDTARAARATHRKKNTTTTHTHPWAPCEPPTCVVRSHLCLHYAKATLALNYKCNTFYPDLTRRTIKDMASVDIYHAGFPCQPFSVAGKGEGLGDPRSNIIHHLLMYIKTHRPTLIVLENVKGLATIHKPVLDSVMKHLGDYGYTVTWRILNARNHGLPQNRERIIIIAAAKERVTEPFRWPFPLPPVLLEDFLEPLPSREQCKELNNALPPANEVRARQHVLGALRILKKNGLAPATTPMVIDVGGSRACMMYNCSPCLTKSRAAAGGHWLTTRGRRQTLQEMQWLMGVGIMPPQGRAASILRPDSVSDAEWGAMIGNSIPLPLLQRVLAGALFWSKLSQEPIIDVWEP